MLFGDILFHSCGQLTLPAPQPAPMGPEKKGCFSTVSPSKALDPLRRGFLSSESNGRWAFFRADMETDGDEFRARRGPQGIYRTGICHHRGYVFKYLTDITALPCKELTKFIFPRRVYNRACFSAPGQHQASLEGWAQRGYTGALCRAPNRSPGDHSRPLPRPSPAGGSPRGHPGGGSAGCRGHSGLFSLTPQGISTHQDRLTLALSAQVVGRFPLSKRFQSSRLTIFVF